MFPVGTEDVKLLAESRSGKTTREYISYHHFPVEYLRADGSGLKTKMVNTEEAMTLKLTKREKVGLSSPKYLGQYILAPVVTLDSACAEAYVSHGGDSKENAPRPRKPPAIRMNPIARAESMLTNRIAARPNEYAVGYETLGQALVDVRRALAECTGEKEELRQTLEETVEALQKVQAQEQRLLVASNTGLSCANLLSNQWHKRNKNAASHLFGGAFESWDDFKDMVTMVFSPAWWLAVVLDLPPSLKRS